MISRLAHPDRTVLSCDVCHDGIVLHGTDEQRAEDERWWSQRHPDEKHEPPSTVTVRRKR